MVLTKGQAIQILNDVENGVAPKAFVTALSPRKNPFFERTVRRDVEIISDKDCRFSRVRFLKGAYGDGKTHFLSYVKEYCLEHGYVVSSFPISSRGISFDMLERSLAEMVKTLSVVDKREGTGRESVLDFIVKRWYESTSTPERAFDDVVDFDSDARQAVLTLARALQQPDQNRDVIAMVNDWFQAKAHPIGALRSSLGVYNHLKASNALRVLKFLSQFFELAGYQGWAILIDEQEIVSTLLTPRRRDLTDENLRLLIDEQGEVPRAYFLFATTSEFFTDPVRGVNSYPALKSRVTTNNTYELPALSKAEMVEIGKNLRAIYEIAEGRESKMTDEMIERFAAVAADRLQTRSARARVFVKAFVRALRDVDQGKRMSGDQFQDVVDGIYNEVADQREAALDEVTGGR
jgi:hypothetical protein